MMACKYPRACRVFMHPQITLIVLPLLAGWVHAFPVHLECTIPRCGPSAHTQRSLQNRQCSEHRVRDEMIAFRPHGLGATSLRTATEVAGETTIEDYQSSWQYSYSNERQSKTNLEKSGGIIYRQSIFEKQELDVIQQSLQPLMKRLNEETASTVATKRMGAALQPSDPVVQLLQTGSMAQFIKRQCGRDFILSSHLPVEVRSYERAGAGMAWHVDDVLYDPPQVEAVITLENTSDCATMWTIEASGSSRIIKEEKRQTDPNSVVLIQAGGPKHCVTPLKRGKRIILKCAYAASGATFQEGIHNDQFGKTKRSQTKQSQKRGGKSKRK